MARITREQFDALALGLPWQRIGEAGVITVLYAQRAIVDCVDAHEFGMRRHHVS